MRFRPNALTLMRASPAAGAGLGMSSMKRFSAGPVLFLIARVLLVSLGACCYAIGVSWSVQTAFMVAMVIIDWIVLVLSSFSSLECRKLW